MKDKGSRSLGLIPVVGSLLIVAILIVVALQVYGGGKSEDTEAITKPIERASVLQCRTQIRNITNAIEFHVVQYGHYPADLQVLKNVSDTMIRCPATGTPYTYDPETGRVTCPDHP